MNIDLSNINEVVAEVEKEKPAEELIEQAIVQLDSVCDGAITQDGIGFAGMHTYIGKKIASRLKQGIKLTIREIRWADRALPYYLNTQLNWLSKKDFNLAIKNAFKRENARHQHTLNVRKKEFEQIS